MDKLERNVLERIGRLKVAVKEGEAVVADEVQQAGQIIEGLKDNIAKLETKLKLSVEAFRKKVDSSRKIEESLTGQIQALQSEVKKKEQALEARANEVGDLNSKLDAQTKHAAQLESHIEKLKAEAVNQAKRADDFAEAAKTRIATLEAGLRETEEIVRAKDQLLSARTEEIGNLKSQMQGLTRGVKDMVSFFRQAEALAGTDRQEAGAAAFSPQPTAGKPKAAAARAKGSAAKSKVAATDGQTLSADFFERMTMELTQLMGPMASRIIDEQVAALGESIEAFPKDRARELVNAVGKEIPDVKLKKTFRQRLTSGV
jgi:hypothetical protein